MKYKLNAESKKVKAKVCSEQGIIETSEICNSFRPNLNDIRGVMQFDGMEFLIELAGKMENKNLQSLSALLRSIPRTRKEGYEFGQKVYVQYRGLAGRLYISNFMSCYIMMANREILRVMSKDGKCILTYDRENVPKMYTEHEYEILKNSMIENGDIVDKDVKRATAKRMRALENYEIGMTTASLEGKTTSIDDVFKFNKIPRAKNDLVSIVDQIQKGYEVKQEIEKVDRVTTKKKKTSRGKLAKGKAYVKGKAEVNASFTEDGVYEINM